MDKKPRRNHHKRRMAHNSIQKQQISSLSTSKLENGHGPSSNQRRPQMNFEKLQIVRDTIAAKPEHFNMTEFFEVIEEFYDYKGSSPDFPEEYLTACGTVACIAGYTVAIFEPKGDIFYVSQTARHILEILEGEATYIFLGHWSLNCLSNISTEEALWYLDGVLKTKNIYWNREQKTYWPQVSEEGI